MPRGRGYGDYAKPIYVVATGTVNKREKGFKNACDAKSYARYMVSNGFPRAVILRCFMDGRSEPIGIETPYKGELENIIA